MLSWISKLCEFVIGKFGFQQTIEEIIEVNKKLHGFGVKYTVITYDDDDGVEHEVIVYHADAPIPGLVVKVK